jgi:hypothetical protein
MPSLRCMEGDEREDFGSRARDKVDERALNGS